MQYAVCSVGLFHKSSDVSGIRYQVSRLRHEKCWALATRPHAEVAEVVEFAGPWNEEPTLARLEPLLL